MDRREVSRRQFLFQTAAGVSSAWLVAHWPGILAAAEHAHRVAQSAVPARFEFLTPAQAAEIEAVAAQIIPSDETPGAREARVIYFIDRALVTFDRNRQKVYRKGLKELQADLKQMFPGTPRFSAASAEQQIGVLKAIEKTDFFRQVRTHTVMGFLADPRRGGNHNEIGWKLIGYDSQYVFEPPFGHYDRDYAGWEATMRATGKS